ncbi:hypothetical protein [Methylophaga thiooxydans]|uniref:hypothetical protein n=1 Tax=Methylophaga thiooxydans TaxID=392484 RepID=UPI001ED8DEA4|nr:hypothetical protein [Methylophaga thiooxydans]
MKWYRWLAIWNEKKPLPERGRHTISREGIGSGSGEAETTFYAYSLTFILDLQIRIYTISIKA